MELEEILAILKRLGLRVEYVCDIGPHNGDVRIGMLSPYMSADEFARLTKAIKEAEGATYHEVSIGRNAQDAQESGELAIGVGHMPWRKKQCITVRESSVIYTIAYCRNSEEAARFWEALKRVAQASYVGKVEE